MCSNSPMATKLLEQSRSPPHPAVCELLYTTHIAFSEPLYLHRQGIATWWGSLSPLWENSPDICLPETVLMGLEEYLAKLVLYHVC